MSSEFETVIWRRRNVELGVQSTASSDGVPLIVSLGCLAASSMRGSTARLHGSQPGVGAGGGTYGNGSSRPAPSTTLSISGGSSSS